MRELSRDHQLVRYDQRANGLSDWTAEDLSFEALVDDVEAVVSAAGLRRYALLGISQGCALAIAHAVRYPERVSGLILYGGYVRGWARRGDEARAAGEAMLTLALHGWGRPHAAFRQLFTSLFCPGATLDVWAASPLTSRRPAANWRGTTLARWPGCTGPGSA